MIPYERLIQWLAGPNSAIVGFLTMKLANAKFLGSLHLGKAAVSHAILDVATFAGGAVVTYAAHHKWLSNVAHWWTTVEAASESLPSSLGSELPPPATDPVPLESARKSDVEAPEDQPKPKRRRA